MEDSLGKHIDRKNDFGENGILKNLDAEKHNAITKVLLSMNDLVNKKAKIDINYFVNIIDNIYNEYYTLDGYSSRKGGTLKSLDFDNKKIENSMEDVITEFENSLKNIIKDLKK